MDRRKRKTVAPPSIATLVLSLYSSGQHDPQLIRLALLRESPFITLACIKDILNAAHVREDKSRSKPPRKVSELDALANEIKQRCSTCPYKRQGLPCVLPRSLCPQPDADTLYARWAEMDVALRRKRYILASKNSISTLSFPNIPQKRTYTSRTFQSRMDIFDNLEDIHFANDDSLSDVGNVDFDEIEFGDSASRDFSFDDFELQDEEFSFGDADTNSSTLDATPIRFLSEESVDTDEDAPDLITAIVSAKSESEFWLDEYSDVFSDFIIGLGNLP